MLYVANVKGIGSRNPEQRGDPRSKARSSGATTHARTWARVSLMPLPKAGNRWPLYARRCWRTTGCPQAQRARSQPREGARRGRCPSDIGEPSVLKHVLYIIKENRTYDQVFGDVARRARAIRELCIFGEKVTPNQHKLADEFVLLDNFYCSGRAQRRRAPVDRRGLCDRLHREIVRRLAAELPVSTAAMRWPTPAADFIWDNVLAQGETLRVYGEFVRATVRWKDPAAKADRRSSTAIAIIAAGPARSRSARRPTIKTLEPYICPTSIGFPDHRLRPVSRRASSARVEAVRSEGRDAEPDDHGSCRTTTPPARSRACPRPRPPWPTTTWRWAESSRPSATAKFWPETCIFVVEDDPQNGFDHIDGHRTVALVVSPYTRRRVVDSTNYNQTSMVRTIELILGLPPMNQLDASATPMASCFSRQARPDALSRR